MVRVFKQGPIFCVFRYTYLYVIFKMLAYLQLTWNDKEHFCPFLTSKAIWVVSVRIGKIVILFCLAHTLMFCRQNSSVRRKETFFQQTDLYELIMEDFKKNCCCKEKIINTINYVCKEKVPDPTPLFLPISSCT